MKRTVTTINLDTDSDGKPKTGVPKAVEVETSRINGSDEHLPVIDIDFPCELRESETPGHHHLLIDRPMSWETYQVLLLALAEAGIVQRGYVNASQERGFTCVATVPWKGASA